MILVLILPGLALVLVLIFLGLVLTFPGLALVLVLIFLDLVLISLGLVLGVALDLVLRSVLSLFPIFLVLALVLALLLALIFPGRMTLTWAAAVHTGQRSSWSGCSRSCRGCSCLYFAWSTTTL